MLPEKLTPRDVELLMRLVDKEIHSICNEVTTLLPAPEARELTQSDCDILRKAHISWEGDTRA